MSGAQWLSARYPGDCYLPEQRKILGAAKRASSGILLYRLMIATTQTFGRIDWKNCEEMTVMMQKRNIVSKFAFVFLLLISVVYGSGDAGFVIRRGSFSLAVRFNILADENPPDEWLFLYKPGTLFLQSLMWVSHNAGAIENETRNMTLRFQPSFSTIDIFEDSDVENVKTVSYNAATVVDSFTALLNGSFTINGKKCSTKASVSLYMMESGEYFDAYNKSDVFWGNFTSYMYDFETKKYRAFFWYEKPKDFFPGKTKQKQIYLSDSNIELYFDDLE
ncbi:hypothetical protein CHISP_2055 [Chitinispirillum alkaliphilum]|nr:hypothetical protein CHISP_2055 [Chitinispirillum alkaliphilum]